MACCAGTDGSVWDACAPVRLCESIFIVWSGLPCDLSIHPDQTVHQLYRSLLEPVCSGNRTDGHWWSITSRQETSIRNIDWFWPSPSWFWDGWFLLDVTQIVVYRGRFYNPVLPCLVFLVLRGSARFARTYERWLSESPCMIVVPVAGSVVQKDVSVVYELRSHLRQGYVGKMRNAEN